MEIDSRDIFMNQKTYSTLLKIDDSAILLNVKINNHLRDNEVLFVKKHDKSDDIHVYRKEEW